MSDSTKTPGIFSRIGSFLFGGYSSTEQQPQIKSSIGRNYNHLASQYPSGQKFVSGIDRGSTLGRIINHRSLRREARAAVHDTPQARALVTRFGDVVGDIGLRAESNPIPDILGISPEAAEEWAEDFDTRFDLWAQNKKQHRSGNMSFYQTHKPYSEWMMRDNDMFVRLYYPKDADLLNGLQFEFVDPDQINGIGATTTFGFTLPFDGIKRDERGREISYSVQVQKPDGSLDIVEIPRVGARSKRLFMLHGFSQEYANQGRGFSRLGFALQEFSDLTNLSIAHINKAIIHAGMAGAIIPSEEEDSSDPFEGIATQFGTGPAAESFGANPVPPEGAQGVTTESIEPLTCYDIPESTTRVPSIFFANLKRGESIELLKNQSPQDSYNTFVDAFTSYITAAASMPLEVLLMKFGENFSASRGALLLFWQVAAIWREEMAADYLNPVREMYASVEIAAGRLKAPGFSDPRLRAAWLNCKWFGAPAPDIDPSKTAKATAEKIKLGIQTGTQSARMTNGSNFMKNKRRLEKEYGEAPPPPWRKDGSPVPDNEENITEPEEDE